MRTLPFRLSASVVRETKKIAKRIEKDPSTLSLLSSVVDILALLESSSVQVAIPRKARKKVSKKKAPTKRLLGSKLTREEERKVPAPPPPVSEPLSVPEPPPVVVREMPPPPRQEPDDEPSRPGAIVFMPRSKSTGKTRDPLKDIPREERRVVSAVSTPAAKDADSVASENHIRRGCVCSSCGGVFYVTPTEFEDLQEAKRKTGQRPVCESCKKDPSLAKAAS
ncbi:MAG: hypothetical protein KGI79_01855 [Patescibacteria group bacterium]|nr:hypothetical protein [Patescibacteria group bacterium]MDE2116596.1 hypothetical protein [Patescibacteria group bacterium]